MVDIVITESVEKMVSKLEVLVADLDEKRNELNSKKTYYERVSRFLAYTRDDVNLVGIYADQELILDNLNIINSNKEHYRASCYLLKSSDENVKSLPQYKAANLFIVRIIGFFKDCKNQLLLDIQNLEKICREKEIEKKYYDIFKASNPLVDDVLEFKDFLDKHANDEKEKIDLLVYVINCNVSNYEGKRS